MTLTLKTTHVTEAKARLVEQFKLMPDFEAWIEAYVDQIQDLETAFFELLLNRALGQAVGDQLDGLGDIVGEDRKGKNDADYELYIRARMITNRSAGEGEYNIDILNLLISNTFEILDYYPAAWSIVISNVLAESPTALAEILTKAAGVLAYIEYTLISDARTFTFASGDTHEVNVLQGWSNDGGTSGGRFADAVGVS